MLARADSQGIQSLPARSPPPFPAWARPVNTPESDAEAAFLAGAALARLDAIVRENPAWAGVWRQRLGLSAAAASARRAGRTEDEASLRDAFHLTRPGADPGPAGQRLLAWRELSARSVGHWRSSFKVAAAALGVAHDEALQEAIEAAEAGAGDKRPAPFAADELEAAGLADDPRQVLAHDRLGGGEDRRLDPAHPFAPARRRRQVVEFRVQLAVRLSGARHRSEPVEPERRASSQFADRAERDQPVEQPARPALGHLPADFGGRAEGVVVEQRR